MVSNQCHPSGKNSFYICKDILSACNDLVYALVCTCMCVSNEVLTFSASSPALRCVPAGPPGEA